MSSERARLEFEALSRQPDANTGSYGFAPPTPSLPLPESSSDGSTGPLDANTGIPALQAPPDPIIADGDGQMRWWWTPNGWFGGWG